MKTQRMAIAGAAAALAVGGVVAANLAVNESTTDTQVAISTFPPPPQNCRAYEVGSDYAKVNCGPSIPGQFIIEPAPDGRSAVIRWGGSTDELYPTGITYTFSKNGKVLWRDRAQTWARVGFTLSVRTFTTCVVPHSQSGFGPKRCTKWTGQ